MTKAIILVIFSLLFVLSTQYDQNIAHEMAKASFATYCGGNRLDGLKCGTNCNSLKAFGYSFNRQAQFGMGFDESMTYSTFISTSKKRVVLAFRGTNTIMQGVKEVGLSAGVNFGLCPHVKGAKALLYFYAGYTGKIRNTLHNHVRSLIKAHPGFSFYITGHSLGGALATLASLDLSCNGILHKNQIHLYTFGSPRVGDTILANAAMNAVAENWRVVHDKDLVPHIPPCKMNGFGQCTSVSLGLADALFGPFNYGWHLGNQIHYSQDFKSFRHCSAEDTNCSNKTPLPGTNINDHNVYLGTRQVCN